jgi:hypothetical protein
MYVRKAVAIVLLIWCLHVIALSKVTSRYVTIFTKGMSHPFSCSMSSGALKSSGETDHLNFPFIYLYIPVLIPRIHCCESSLQYAENTMFVFLCCVSTGIVHEQSKMSTMCHRGIIYVYTIQYWGKDGTLRNPSHYFSWRRKFAFYQDFKFSVN